MCIGHACVGVDVGLCVRLCGVQLCMVSKANEMIFNGCFVLRELMRRDGRAHTDTRCLNGKAKAIDGAAMVRYGFRRQPKCLEKTFCFSTFGRSVDLPKQMIKVYSLILSIFTHR